MTDKNSLPEDVRILPKLELPKYRCHKVVGALKIKRIEPRLAGGTIPDGHQLVPEDNSYSAFALSHDFIERHKPKPGGYYVVYEDGYASYSPADAFESGYTRIS